MYNRSAVAVPHEWFDLVVYPAQFDVCFPAPPDPMKCAGFQFDKTSCLSLGCYVLGALVLLPGLLLQLR
jgi:hypothetical protein